MCSLRQLCTEQHHSKFIQISNAVERVSFVSYHRSMRITWIYKSNKLKSKSSNLQNYSTSIVTILYISRPSYCRFCGIVNKMSHSIEFMNSKCLLIFFVISLNFKMCKLLSMYEHGQNMYTFPIEGDCQSN